MRPAIALSGSAGTGKSTLGQALARRWGVPYLAEPMRARLEAGLNLHDLTHEDLQALLLELWDEQQRAEAEAMALAGGFVADRSSVDFAAFWVHYRFTEDADATARFVGQTLAHQTHYQRIVLLPWGALPLVADGVRSSNPWIQRHFQATVEGLLFREVGPPRLLLLPHAVTALEARVRWVASAVGGSPAP